MAVADESANAGRQRGDRAVRPVGDQRIHAGEKLRLAASRSGRSPRPPNDGEGRGQFRIRFRQSLREQHAEQRLARRRLDHAGRAGSERERRLEERHAENVAGPDDAEQAHHGLRGTGGARERARIGQRREDARQGVLDHRPREPRQRRQGIGGTPPQRVVGIEKAACGAGQGRGALGGSGTRNARPQAC